MPANLTPEYLKADKWFKQATTTSERILALEEMLRTIPRHKGTDHMRADLRRKLSKLKESAVSEKKRGGKHVDIFHIPKSGSGQIVLIGTPNCGKSSIVGALSHAKVNIAEYPFATTIPTPGMIQFQDVSMQLVDMPPVTAEYSAPGQVGSYRGCDLIAIVIDLCANVKEQLRVCLDFLESHRLLLDEQTPAADGSGNLLGRKAFVIATKSDTAGPKAIQKLKKSCPRSFEIVIISSKDPQDLGKLTAKIFELLDLIRIYAKKPGKKPDMNDPFTLPRGSTVMDLAKSIHRELAEKLKSAKAWGANVRDGQNVHRTYQPADKDIIELHFS